MPKYNSAFRSPEFREETIVDKDTGTVRGTVRLKPSSILWKPKSAHKFYSVSLETFVDWITDRDTGAARTKS